MHPLVPRTVGATLNGLAHVAPALTGRVGFRLFCQVLAPPLPAHHRSFLESARAFTMSDRGDRIQGYRWGQGPRRILLVHGWASNAYFWRRLIGTLSPDEFTVVAYDLPAHGLSGGRWLHLPRSGGVLARVLAEQGPFEAVVGHSFGAFSSLYVLGQQPPGSVERVVVLACPGRVSDFMQYYQGLLGLHPRTMRLIDARCEQLLGQPVGWFNAADFARGLALPGLIVHDRADAEAPFAHAERMAAGWPRAHFVPTEGLGHNLRSEALVAALADYLHTQRLPEPQMLAAEPLPA